MVQVQKLNPQVTEDRLPIKRKTPYIRKFSGKVTSRKVDHIPELLFFSWQRGSLQIFIRSDFLAFAHINGRECAIFLTVPSVCCCQFALSPYERKITLSITVSL